MNRNLFLKTLLVAGTPLAALAVSEKRVNQKWIDKGIIVQNGKDRHGRPISLFEGDTFYRKVTTEDSAGDIFVFESTRIKEGGPSFHLHYEQDEFWYIIKGEFLFKVGDEAFTAKTGDTVFGPRNVPHAFSKIGKGEAKLLMFFQPAGKMEEMFRKISEGVTKNMNEAEMNQFRHDHGIKKVGPALGHFKKW